jgi:hypothetical protein
MGNSTPSVRASALLGILGLFLISPAYAQYGGEEVGEEFADDVMDQLTSGVETGISSIDVPPNNPIETTNQEVDDLAHSTSEWIEALFNFGKKTHSVTEDAMAVAAPSWIDPIIIAVIAGAVVVFVMWKVVKKVGIHMAIGFGFLAAVIVFLMLLDLNS